jgi:hypothetical protein
VSVIVNDGYRRLVFIDNGSLRTPLRLGNSPSSVTVTWPRSEGPTFRFSDSLQN